MAGADDEHGTEMNNNAVAGCVSAKGNKGNENLLGRPTAWRSVSHAGKCLGPPPRPRCIEISICTKLWMLSGQLKATATQACRPVHPPSSPPPSPTCWGDAAQLYFDTPRAVAACLPSDTSAVCTSRQSSSASVAGQPRARGRCGITTVPGERVRQERRRHACAGRMETARHPEPHTATIVRLNHSPSQGTRARARREPTSRRLIILARPCLVTSHLDTVRRADSHAVRQSALLGTGGFRADPAGFHLSLQNGHPGYHVRPQSC